MPATRKTAARVHVFLSHSSKDKPFVEQLSAWLEGSGVQTFLDKKDIRVGDSIPATIYKSIGKATHLIYVISKGSLSSKWVAEELSIAKMREKEVQNIRIF